MHVLALPLALSITFAAPRAQSNDERGPRSQQRDPDIARSSTCAPSICSARDAGRRWSPSVVPLLQALPPAAHVDRVDSPRTGGLRRPRSASSAKCSWRHHHGADRRAGRPLHGSDRRGTRGLRTLRRASGDLHTAAPRLGVTRFAAEAKQLAAARAAGGDAWRALAGRGWRALIRTSSGNPSHPRPRISRPTPPRSASMWRSPRAWRSATRWSSTPPRGWTSRSSAAGPATRCVSPTSPARPNVRIASCRYGRSAT